MFDDEDLAAVREDWEADTVEPAPDAYGERQDRFATVSNREIDRLYTPDDVADVDYEAD